jgi:ACT domain-containing protein
MKTDLKGDFVKLIEDGFTVSSACKKLGIHRSTFYEWQGDDPMFGYKVTMARHTSVERITDVAEQWMCKWVADGDRKSV